jgi:hypothetical protein
LNFNAFAVDWRLSAHAQMISVPAVFRASSHVHRTLASRCIPRREQADRSFNRKVSPGFGHTVGTQSPGDNGGADTLDDLMECQSVSPMMLVAPQFRTARSARMACETKCSSTQHLTKHVEHFEIVTQSGTRLPQSFPLLPAAAQGLVELDERCEFVASRLREL